MLPTSGWNVGQIDITYDAFGTAGPVTDVLIDVVGYLTPGGGETGPPGPEGPPGADGEPGPAYIPGYEIVSGQAISFAGTDDVTLEANCPPGKVVLGGGVQEGTDARWAIEDSRPKADGTGWQVELVPTNTVVGGAAGVTAICATAPPP